MQCPCCYASAPGEISPHGENAPCPTALELRRAEIDEIGARKQLLEAQRDATLANIRRSS